MYILIAGGTGFVGKHLTKALQEKGHHIYILTRSPEAYDNNEQTTYISYENKTTDMPDFLAVINLAGDSLFGYWTAEKKENILKSRLETTEKIILFMKQMKTKPSVFINASAIGFYGTSLDHIYTEKTTDAGTDFLADVVMQWEAVAKQAEALGIRTVYTRFGVILGTKGALPLMRLPVKLFAGGKIGSGEQWTSWVHIDDLVQLIVFSLFNEAITGPVNVTSPEPKRNKDFTKILAKVLKRPYWMPTPKFIIRLAIGEMSTLITQGQYVLPKKALDHNFQFKYPDLADALQEITSKKDG